MSDRYDTSDAPEGQFEPGSGERVLRNLRGIVDPAEMDRLEAALLARTLDSQIHEIDADHRFVVADVRRMHKEWLREIYPWAGSFRTVNLEKDGFPFAAAHLINDLLATFERQGIRCWTSA